MELQAILRARCLLGVEMMGRSWAKEENRPRGVKGVDEVKEKVGATGLRKSLCGFGELNIGNDSTELARE
jgi:hypothetical protein